jgi:hypothetical protein
MPTAQRMGASSGGMSWVFALSQFGAAAPNDLRLNIGNIDLADEFAGTFAAHRGDGPRATRTAPHYEASILETPRRLAERRPPPPSVPEHIQEFLGHADSKTTQIYAHYAPSAHEVEIVNAAFAEESLAESEPARTDPLEW